MASPYRNELVKMHRLSEVIGYLQNSNEAVKGDTLHLNLLWWNGSDVGCLPEACRIGNEDFRKLIGIFKQLYEVKKVVLYNELGSACCLEDVKIEGLRWEKNENFPK